MEVLIFSITSEDSKLKDCAVERCSRCGSSPARFKIEKQALCGADFAAITSWKNALEIAKEEVAAVVPENTIYTLRDRCNIDGKGRFMLMGPATLLITDSLDEIIARAESWKNTGLKLVPSRE